MIRKAILIISIILACCPAFAAPVQPVDGGGIESADVRDHVTPQQRLRINQRLRENRLMLRESGLLPKPEHVAEAQVILTYIRSNAVGSGNPRQDAVLPEPQCGAQLVARSRAD